jgi:hypothetical protein
MNDAPDWLEDIPTFIPDPNADYTDPLWTGLDILYDILPLAEFVQLFVDIFTSIPL